MLLQGTLHGLSRTRPGQGNDYHFGASVGRDMTHSDSNTLTSNPPRRVMQCPEQLRSEQFYESALRRWAQLSTPDGVTSWVDQIRRRTLEERHAATSRLRTHMLTIAPGRVKVSRVLVVSIGLLALAALAIAIGVRAFLAAVGHYAPWEQIWAG